MSWKRYWWGVLVLVPLAAYLGCVGMRAVALAAAVSDSGLSSLRPGEVAMLLVPSMERMGRSSGEGFGGIAFLLAYLVGSVVGALSALGAYAAPLLRRGRALGLGSALAALATPLLLGAVALALLGRGVNQKQDQELLTGAVALAVAALLGFWSAALVTRLVAGVELWSRPRAGEPAPAILRVNGLPAVVCLVAPLLLASAVLYFGLVWNPHKALVNRAALGDAAGVASLLEAGASPDGADRAGQRPLCAASSSTSTEVVRLLLDAGADVNAADGEGRTALFYAAERRRGEVVDLLLSRGARVDVADSLGRTPLNAGVGDADITARLLAQVPSPDFRVGGGPTPLMSACQEGAAETVALLIERGADISGADGASPPLHLALSMNHLDCARVLLEHGADQGPALSAGESLASGSAMTVAAGAGPPAVLLLLDHGAPPDQWVFGRPLLHQAAQSGWTEVARRLVEAGVEVNRVVPGQGTALDAAAGGWCEEVRAYLLSVGAKHESELASQATPE